MSVPSAAGPRDPESEADGLFGKSRSMVFPRVVRAGHGVLEEIGRMCTDFGFPSRGALVTGPTTLDLAGRRCGELLAGAGFEVQTAIAHEATEAEVDRIDAEIAPHRPGFVVAVGGGSKIDIAKVIAGRRRVPFVSVPTSAAHDGISSPRASLHGAKTSSSIEAAVPIGILADTSVIIRAPFRLLASGCADVISNLTALLDWKLAVRLRNEEYSSTAATLSEYAAEEIIEHAPFIKPNLEESAWIAIRPLLVAGIAMSVAGSSRPCSGSEHLFSHALDRIAAQPALHGEQCGVGAIMMMHLHGGDWRRIRDALRTIGAPTDARGLGVQPREIVQALVQAPKLRPERYTILGVHGLAPGAAERLARVTEVIE
ncbi:MAG: NAD(P)-dependent glycerol-1-phosphate dehydrogenase [Thermoplasmata archaeon]